MSDIRSNHGHAGVFNQQGYYDLNMFCKYLITNFLSLCTKLVLVSSCTFKHHLCSDSFHILQSK